MSLLPHSSTQLERDLEKLLAGACDMPLHIRQLWDPVTCPAALLPWLAWANSVDDWQESWPERVKRNVIAAAFDVHRYKATPYALRAALDALGIKTEVVEWWEPQGTGVPGTQTVTALLNDNITDDGGLINAEMLRMISRTIYKTKRASIHSDIELGVYFEEGITIAAGRARAVALACRQPDVLPVLPDDLAESLGAGAVEQRLTASDHELVRGPLLPDEGDADLQVSAVASQIFLHDTQLTGAV